MKPRHIYLLLLLFIYGCKTEQHFIVKSEKFTKLNSSIDKIVMIEPDYIYKDVRKDNAIQYFKSHEKEEKFHKTIVNNGRKNDVEVLIQDKSSIGNTDNSYYESLMPLKNEILYSIVLSEQGSNSKKYRHRKKQKLAFAPNNKEYKMNPIVDASYAELIAEYETKYFATAGVSSVISKPQVNYMQLVLFLPTAVHTLVPKRSSVYYFSLTNVESGEVVYQEIRYCAEKMNETNLNVYLYDTFKYLKSKKI